MLSSLCVAGIDTACFGVTMWAHIIFVMPLSYELPARFSSYRAKCETQGQCMLVIWIWIYVSIFLLLCYWRFSYVVLKFYMKCGFLPGECLRKVAGSKLCSKFCRQKLSKPVQRKPNSTKKTWRLTYPFSELNILSTSSILEFTLYLVKGFWFWHFTDKFSIVKDKQASNVGQKT